MTHILVIEPDIATLALLESDLRSYKYTFSSCKHVDEAYGVLKKISPDVIICDMYQYALGSLGLLSFIRRDSAYDHTVFIGLFPEDLLHEVPAMMKSGADDFIIKPFQSLDVAQTLTARLTRRRQLQPAAVPARNLNKLIVRGFDALAIAYSGEHLSCNSTKGLELIYFLLEKGSANVFELGEALWPELQPQQVISRLHSTLYRIKDQFDQELIRCHAGRYSLVSSVHVEYDLHHYRTLANDALERDQPKLLQRAINFYGTPLVGLHGAWCDHVRRELLSLQIELLERVIELYQREKVQTMALYNLEELLRLEPEPNTVHNHTEARMEVLLRELQSELSPLMRTQSSVHIHA